MAVVRQRVDEQEAVALTEALRRQLLGGSDVEEIAFQVRGDLALVRRFDLADRNRLYGGGDRVGVQQADGMIQPYGIESCTVQRLAKLGEPDEQGCPLGTDWTAVASVRLQ